MAVGDQAQPELTGLEAAAKALEEGRLDMASRICAELIAADPDNAAAIHLLGVISYESGNGVAEAMELVERAIVIDPHQGKFYNSRGALHYAEDRDHEAAADFRQATLLSPDDSMAWNNLGNALLKLGHLPEAEHAFRRALSR